MATSDPTTSGTSRRALLGAAAALAAIPTAAAPVTLADATPPAALMRRLANPATAAGGGHPGPDDEMIRLCGVYVAMCHHYNTADYSEAEGVILFARMNEVEDQIDDLPPQTLHGVVVKAQMAITLAGQEPEGTGSWQSGPAGDWARDVVHDLARLFGAGGAA